MNTEISHISAIFSDIKAELSARIIGQEELLDALIITVFAGGHALLEGSPGLGKTHTIRTLSEIFSLQNKRISFTPDLIPSDLLGAEIFRPGKSDFEIRKGPIFTNFLLADEINRTPPKIQSALLEAMEERQITIGNETFALPKPFFVFATQNSLEHEGTYPLPEAQLDRFLMKISLDFPTQNAEKNILSGNFWAEKISPLLSGEDILQIQNFIEKNVHADEKIIDYIVRILNALRELTEHDTIFGTDFPLLQYGPSTRAGLALVRTAKVRAVMSGRDFVLPEDIKSLAKNILTHRMARSYEAESENIPLEAMIEKILDTVRILEG